MLAFLYILNALLMIALPLGLGIFLSRKLDVSWRIFGVGMLIFLLSQALHLPFNLWVLNPAVKRLGLDAAVPLELAGVAASPGCRQGCSRRLPAIWGTASGSSATTTAPGAVP
jgi:hypothetical protein